MTDTIASGALPLAVLVAALAGLVSFASPCVLPLVPGFLGYVTGLSETALEQRSRGRMVLGAVLFVLGFAAVFVLGSIFIASLGRVLIEQRVLLMRVGGVFIIVMGLVFLGAGPTLAAVLTLSASTTNPSTGRAVALATAYALGLGLPFILAAAGIERFGRVTGWVREHHRLIQSLGGGMLIMVGLLLLTGVWEDLTRWLQAELVSGFTTPI